MCSPNSQDQDRAFRPMFRDVELPLSITAPAGSQNGADQEFSPLTSPSYNVNQYWRSAPPDTPLQLDFFTPLPFRSMPNQTPTPAATSSEQGFVQQGYTNRPKKEPYDNFENVGQPVADGDFDDSLRHGDWIDSAVHAVKDESVDPDEVSLHLSKRLRRSIRASKTTGVLNVATVKNEASNEDVFEEEGASSYEEDAYSKKRKPRKEEGDGSSKRRMCRTISRLSRELHSTTTMVPVFDSNRNEVTFKLWGLLSLSGKVDYDGRYGTNVIYKRNTFALSECSYVIQSYVAGEVDGFLYLERDGMLQPISSLSLETRELSTKIDADKVGLEQFTDAKRDKKRVPPAFKVGPYLAKGETVDKVMEAAHRFTESTGDVYPGKLGTIDWGRVSFKYGTSHNGTRRNDQAFSSVALFLIAELEDGELVELARSASDNYIVVARSPSGIKHKPHERPGPRGRKGRTAARTEYRRDSFVVEQEDGIIPGPSRRRSAPTATMVAPETFASQRLEDMSAAPRLDSILGPANSQHVGPTAVHPQYSRFTFECQATGPPMPWQASFEVMSQGYPEVDDADFDPNSLTELLEDPDLQSASSMPTLTHGQTQAAETETNYQDMNQYPSAFEDDPRVSGPIDDQYQDMPHSANPLDGMSGQFEYLNDTSDRLSAPVASCPVPSSEELDYVYNDQGHAAAVRYFEDVKEQALKDGTIDPQWLQQSF